MFRALFTPSPVLLSLLTSVISLASSPASDAVPTTTSATATKAEFSTEQVEFFEKEVRPLLAESCLDCHTGTKAKLGLELNHREGWLSGSDYRKVVNLEKPAESVLIKAVSHAGEKGIPSMPEKGDKLSADAVAKLTTWIGMGLPWPAYDESEKPSDPLQHWSFQPVKATPLPTDAGHPVDHFIRLAQTKAGVTAAPRADRATLYRRLHFGLLGLPPRHEDLKRFVADKRSDDEAYAALADQLLASPQYGERWARLWMDVARYADTKGYEGAGTERRFIYSYTYRDWLIRSFNEDLPYDKFLLYQLAAEQLVDANGPDKHHLAALGFLSLSKNGSQDEILDDRIDTTFRGTMALTVSCAKCHDHKFDPIPTKDYYSLYGVFLNSLAIETPIIGEPAKTPEYEEYATELAAKQKEIDDMIHPHLERAKQENPNLAANRAGLLSKVDREVRKKMQNLEGARDKFIADSGLEPDKAIILRERTEPINQHVFIRGNASRRGDLAPRQFLAVASEGEQKPFTKGAGRLEMAQEIVRPTNPLTARNIVNRVWMWHFGEGIVRTVDDFGIMGERPDHPELLDWLAHWFIENGSSIKKLHRLIVTSETWRQQSVNDKTEQNMLVDAENRLLWKFKKKRLELEQMRDGMLAVAGNLNREMYGRPVEILDTGYSNRRSVYAFIDRQNLNPTFRNFDFSNPQETTGKRQNTTIPMQALFTLNNPFVMDQAEVLANKTESEQDRVASLHRAVFAGDPSESDRQLAESFISVFNSETAAMGKRQTNTEWSYGWGDIDPASGKVVFHPFEVWKENVWQVGAERPLKNNPLSYLFTDRNGNAHPGHTAKESLIYEWRAPADLHVAISGVVHRSNAGKGNGVRVKVATSSAGVVYDQVFDPAKDKMEVKIPELNIASHEAVYFIVDPHKNDSSFDSVRWNPEVSDLANKWPKWELAESFSGPATPASAWGAYAQALLNTNRFLFVD